MHDYEAIYRVSAELSNLLYRQTPLEKILDGIGNLAVAVIPACEEAGVSLEENGKIVARRTTGETARSVDAFQYEIGEGPCLHASRTGETVLIENMGTDARCPRFANFAHTHGVQSSYSIPMRAESETLGVLNLYSTGNSFGAPDEDVGNKFAQEATDAVRHSAAFEKTRELIDNLNAALESRSVIGAAVGIAMHREHISMAEAFDKLVKLSQRENLKLREVAERITEVYEAGFEINGGPE